MSNKRRKTGSPSFALISEDLGEYVELFCKKTLGMIFCATRQHFKDPDQKWLEARGLVDPDQLIDVIQLKPFEHNRDDAITFEHDAEMKDGQVPSYLRLLVDFVCLLFFRLDQQQNKKQIGVFCKNGRSRSPCVILAYFMLVGGCDRVDAEQFLTKAFTHQRPGVAGHYDAFPNWRKFERLMMQLDIVIKQSRSNTDTWIRTRVEENCRFLNALLRSQNIKTYSVEDFYQSIIGNTPAPSPSRSRRANTRFVHPTTFAPSLPPPSSSSSSSSTPRASTRDKSRSFTAPQFTAGLRVKCWWLSGATAKSKRRWFVGTLVQDLGNGKWRVDYDDGQIKEEAETRLHIAFEQDVRVNVYYNCVPLSEGKADKRRSKEQEFKAKQKEVGSIINQTHTFSYIVRLDTGGRICAMHGGDMDLLNPFDESSSDGGSGSGSKSKSGSRGGKGHKRSKGNSGGSSGGQKRRAKGKEGKSKAEKGDVPGRIMK